MNLSGNQKSRLKSWFVYSPGLASLIVALSFLLISAAYLVFSTAFATESSASVSDLGRFELIKGLVFMAVTALLLGLIVLLLLRMIRNRERSLSAHRQSLLQAERRALTSLFAATVAHDANNLLCVARGQLELSLGSKTLPPAEVDRLDRVLRMLNNLVEINKRMVDSSRRSQSNSRHSFDVNRHVCRALDFISYNPLVRQCHLNTELQGGLIVVGDPLLLEQALINLVLNAAEASPPRTDILVRTAMDSGAAIVEVHDGGPGVPKDMRDKVFDPFFSNKEDGAGLGLLTVRSFADAHHAALSLGDSDLGGACFRIAIPMEAGSDGQ